MTFLKKLGCAAAFGLAAGASQASIMNDWTFNPAGSGQAKGQEINEYLDVNGNAFIELNATSKTSFNFVEHAVFNLSQADSNGQLFPVNYAGGNITATFEGYGAGTFGGAFKFTGGTIKMYQNPANGQYGSVSGIYGANLGNLIGTFTVLAGGGGTVDGKGNPTDNGQVSIFLKASKGALAANYFFDDLGQDMSGFNVEAFAFTNANTVGAPTNRLVKEVACQFAGFTGPGCAGNSPYKNVAGDHFFVSNNGQFKFNEIPEPGSVALFGIALFGIGALRRRVK
ncbi:flocculation-associated PEP-CTERM protein PepA [Massilia litorea]|uniref:Flocculation-associated PEP-CTERM protein PepA n=1 Tax=Massilia litorea TaxID=2769491 RepID=A0A7L9U2L8_9BURK|nr:flocculation-associated PEP-CTERM protein PepA [Massilia litorea]QOL49167.1 flocculation-associated PEP-CTERM protein PepA [Massilia litorea]